MKLGAHCDGRGTNFSVYSEQAQRIELCLFSGNGDEPAQFVDLEPQSEFRWSVYVPGAANGQRYGFRVHGPYAPEKGERSNPAKLLLDPYARGVILPSRWDDSLYDYALTPASGSELTALRPDAAENFSWAPRGVVCDTEFDWQGTSFPDIPWPETVIYEAHVKGLTIQHPEVPPELRGTYLGLCSEPVIRHLQSLGVTAVELLPVHASLSEPWLSGRGLSNFWGYNTVSFFAPDPRYATAGRRDDPQAVLGEFKEMVRTLHRLGIEVILDVVYNHTAEGSQFGPTLSFRGLDDRVYYRRKGDEGGLYDDLTGCGNTLNAAHPAVQRLIMDSLRYWAEECRIDGFRLDLASAISRDEQGRYFRESPISSAILQDPQLRIRKFIAEPWDATAEGYQLGSFPQGISEWNGKYRDAVRKFWRGDPGAVPGFASAVAGSSDVFNHRGRTVRSSINFVTAHDGFTLHDLVSYERRHNEANGEAGRDGASENFSANCGVEGPSDDREIVLLRLRQKKNFLTTLFFSLGVPMLLGGDESGRTQNGNNNAYCQDNPLSWVDWERVTQFSELKEFIGYLTMIRRRHPALLRQRFLTGEADPETGLRDVVWLKESGQEITAEDWQSPETKCVQICLGPSGAGDGEASLLLLCNPAAEENKFLLPAGLAEKSWRLLLRTDERIPFRVPLSCRSGELIPVPAKTMMVFHARSKE